MTPVESKLTGGKKLAVQILAGGVSGVVNKTAIAPLERVKILMQIQGMAGESKYSGIVPAMRAVVKEEGFFALWKGNFPNCVRIVPNYVCKFTFNDVFKDWARTPGQPLSFNEMLAAGTAAGVMQVLITYPLELVRTRLTLSAALGRGVQYKGMLDCFSRTVRLEGLRGLYKGIGPTLLSGSPYTGLQMSTYAIFRTWMPQDSQYAQIYSLCAGAGAGVVSQTLTYPGDTVRRRMQSNGLDGMPRVYSSSTECLVRIVRHEGVRALFSGCWANVARCVPGTAIQFWSYELVRSMFGVEPIGA